MAKMEKDKDYDIQPIKGENYHDCEFVFGIYKIKAIDGQYFQIKGISPEVNQIWWDNEGFKITEIE